MNDALYLKHEKSEISVQSIKTYGELLNEYSIPFTSKDNFHYAGKLETNYGWIIHISVRRFEFRNLLLASLPVLSKMDVPFKIPINGSVVRDILDGILGEHVVGKLITLYPYSNSIAEDLIIKLSSIVAPFEGPIVRTDYSVNKCIYCRFGGHKKRQVFVDGEYKFFYTDEFDTDIEDPIGLNHQATPLVSLPHFTLKPTGDTKKLSLNLQIRELVKRDAKGDVSVGIYAHKWWNIRQCIVKEGRRNMLADETGADMIARLKWQREVLNLLEKNIPVSKVLDYIETPNSGYLVIERIKGPNLLEGVGEINNSMDHFQDLSEGSQAKLLAIARKIISIVREIHKHQIVHRDITPGNFILNKRNELHLIDTELAYSFDKKYPTIPFLLGTKGYMNKNQLTFGAPDYSDDYFGMCATLILVFCRISPVTVSWQSFDELRDTITLLSGDSEFAESIAQVMSTNGKYLIDNDLDGPAMPSRQNSTNLSQSLQKRLSGQCDKDIIESALSGLSEEPYVLVNSLWTTFDHNTNGTAANTNILTVDPSYHNGILGIISTIIKAKKYGFEYWPLIESFKVNFPHSFDLLNVEGTPLSFHDGKSGLAFVMMEGIEVELLINEPSNFELAELVLQLPSPIGRTAVELSGCAKYLLRRSQLLKEPENRIIPFVDEIAIVIEKESKTYKVHKKDPFRTENSRTFGTVGAAITLLEYVRIRNDSRYEKLLLNYLKRKAKEVLIVSSIIKKSSLWPFASYGGLPIENIYSLAQLFMFSNRTLGDNESLRTAELLLNLFPDRMVHDNFSIDSGLSGLGHLYLQMYSLSKNDKWKQRAKWIHDLLIVTAQKNKYGHLFWTGMNKEQPTPGLMSGTSGIIDFLIQFQDIGNN